MTNEFEKMHLNSKNVGEIADAFGEEAANKVEELKTENATEVMALAGLVNALKEAGQKELAQELISNEDVARYFEVLEQYQKYKPIKKDSMENAKKYVAALDELKILAPKVNVLLKKANEAVS